MLSPGEAAEKGVETTLINSDTRTRQDEKTLVQVALRLGTSRVRPFSAVCVKTFTSLFGREQKCGAPADAQDGPRSVAGHNGHEVQLVCA